MSTITLGYTKAIPIRRESQIGRILILLSLVLIAVAVLVIVVSANADSANQPSSISPIPVPVPTPAIAVLQLIPSETPAPSSVVGSQPSIVPVPTP